ncbi:MAG: DNA polymerase III subunit beta, partial [Candidatus Omnitrophota bacterium]|nr:DNA polymerase III subunit beta [Candidatus Omnitrophota bacterium]
SITIPAKKFSDIIKELPEAMITISAKKNNMVHITCENSQFKIMGIPKDDFPKLPEFKDKDTIRLSQSMLKTMLNMTSFAMSRDETRYVLNGAYLVMAKNTIRVIATDGRRLALIEREIELPGHVDKKFIIPAKTVQELNRNLKEEGELSLSFGNNQIMLNLGGSIIISRLIEGEFPDYEQVIPKESKDKIIIDRDKFFLAAKRASLLTSQDSQAIKLDIGKDRMVISKNSPDIGEAKEELGITYTGSPFSIGFNPYYIMDVLKNLNGDMVDFELHDPEKPAVIRTKDKYIYVLLPMQLS